MTWERVQVRKECMQVHTRRSVASMDAGTVSLWLRSLGCLQVEGVGPKPRSGHSAVAWLDKGILIYGGMNMALETFFDDAWSTPNEPFYESSTRWFSLVAESHTPPPSLAIPVRWQAPSGTGGT
jgi:hypothetical protein